MSSTLSSKAINPQDRLIFALDVATADQALALIDRLGDSVSFYKLGLEMFLSGNYFELIETLNKRDKKIFADLKFFDIPATVAAAVRQIDQLGVTFTTVHGNDSMLAAAADAADEVGVLGVTALTSLDQGDLNDLGFDCDVEQLVLSRARRALALGCAGVVSSGIEVPKLRREVDWALVAVCPGIRPVVNDDDQKRAVDVPTAFKNGADYIVVGRPIRQAEDPAAAAFAIQAQISELFS